VATMPHQQLTYATADQYRVEAHGGNELPIDAADAAEGREFLRALAQTVGSAGKAARPEGAHAQRPDLGAVFRPSRPHDDVSRQAHQLSLLGAPPKTSATRRRVPLVVSSGKASAEKKPCSRISMLGFGMRSCFQSG